MNEMGHRLRHLRLQPLVRALTAALCLIALILACGPKEPLHFLTHEILGSHCETLASSTKTSQSSAGTQTSSADTQASLTTASSHDACLLNAVLETTSHSAFTATAAPDIPKPTSVESSPTLRFETLLASIEHANWHRPRGPPTA